VLDKAFDYLQKALTEFGIGAKTSVGYGYFKERTKKS
jgi:CRISPR/Cas system CMR subunit Cmr6 (Cas7 group RAMP superfamily)